MLIWTGKLHRGRILAIAVAVVILVAGLLWSGLLAGFGQEVTYDPNKPNPNNIKTTEDQIAYLSAYGWQVKAEPLMIEELLIPEVLDASYDDYLSLQSQQGFDLTLYQGERVKRYVYEISNYPTGETGVQVALLIHDNTVIGGEVLSSQLDGFLHGLERPE